MTEFRLHKSPWKLLRPMLLCGVFVGIGFFMLRQQDAPQWIAWAGIVFFGLGLPIGIYELFDRRPQIIINEVGVFDRRMHHEFINWEIIQDAYLAATHRQPFICLVVDEDFEPSRRKGNFGKGLASLSKGLGFQELTISLGLINIDPMRFAEFIQAMRRAEQPEREILVQKAIANL